MKATQVEMPDGTCMTIEGGDSQGIATLLMNKLAHGPVISGSDSDAGEATRPAPSYSGMCNEAPLVMPVMNFGKLDPAQQADGDDMESPLAMPTINWDKPDQSQQSQESDDTEWESPLSMPRMSFGRK